MPVLELLDGDLQRPPARTIPVPPLIYGRVGSAGESSQPDIIIIGTCFFELSLLPQSRFASTQGLMIQPGCSGV